MEIIINNQIYGVNINIFPLPYGHRYLLVAQDNATCVSCAGRGDTFSQALSNLADMIIKNLR